MFPSKEKTERLTPQSGYALFATLVTMVVISSATAATLTMTMAAFRRGEVDIEWAKQEAALEAGIIWASNELAAAPELRAKEHFVDNAQSSINFGGQIINVVVRSEEAKLDVNNADRELVESVIADFASLNELDVLRERLTDIAGKPLRLLDDLWSGKNLSQNTNACLRNRFTVFNGSAEGQAYSPPIPIGRSVTAGRIFDLMAYVDEDDQRAARAIILVTGDDGDPYWTLDWRWVASKLMENCDVDEV